MKRLEDLNILVIGDIMLDKYVEGEVERISPEAPVPVVHVYNEYSTLGGCGNVVRNIRELGPKVACLSSIANDDNGKIVLQKLIDLGVSPLLIDECEKTITKERIIASERKIQMIRVDREVVKPIDPQELIDALDCDFSCSEFDIVVISDYGKGVVSKDIIEFLEECECKYIVDPKPKNQLHYGHPFMITPNEKECKEMGGANQLLINGARYVLETKGKRGMTLYDDNQDWEIDSEEVDVYDVQGAGDTIVAVMATCLSMGWNPLDSSIIANKCAGYVVTKPGTSVIPKDEFVEIMWNHRQGV